MVVRHPTVAIKRLKRLHKAETKGMLPGTFPERRTEAVLGTDSCCWLLLLASTLNLEQAQERLLITAHTC